MRYRLRTLLIVVALGPPLLAVAWVKYSAWRAEQEQQLLLRAISVDVIITNPLPLPPTMTVDVAEQREGKCLAAPVGPPSAGNTR